MVQSTCEHAVWVLDEWGKSMLWYVGYGVVAAGLLCSGSAIADLYRCPQKGGKVEFRDYPCDMVVRPATTPSTAGQGNSNAPPQPAASGKLNFEVARRNCMQLLSQYDLNAPFRGCSPQDQACLQRADRASQQVYRQLIAHPAWEANRCDSILQAESSNNDQFVVVGAIRGCKYFVAEQNGSYSLMEDWLCFRPSRGDMGKGDISTYGLKEVTLNGMSCTAYVDDWGMGRSRAAEKLADKCN